MPNQAMGNDCKSFVSLVGGRRTDANSCSRREGGEEKGEKVSFIKSKTRETSVLHSDTRAQGQTRRDSQTSIGKEREKQEARFATEGVCWFGVTSCLCCTEASAIWGLIQ